MPWTSKRHGHECRPPQERPLFRRVEPGDTWQCRKCGRQWRVTDIFKGTISWARQP